jgi:transcriptional regulator with XRE-family HTH domain
MGKIGRVALGCYLGQIRKSANVTQDKLAIKTGFTSREIISIEHGEKEILLEEAQKIAKVLGYSPYVVNIFYNEPIPPLTPEEKKLITREPPPAVFLPRET